ncbi:MAG: LytTR family transcriptional regulator [Bacteroidales bacterium]|nr:LytTR family transcriptional regulator [Bacteroidales bacterium]
MKAISRTFYHMTANLLFFLVVPVFFFLFVLAYKPFDIEEFLAVGRNRFTLNVIVTTLILFGTLVLSRMFVFLLRRNIDMNWAQYILWCSMEVVFAGMMTSILVGVGWHGAVPYFTVMAKCLLYILAIVIFPYAMITMAIQLYVLGKLAQTAPYIDEKTLIRFYDDQKRLKLVLASTAILYIEAEDNYVHIIHMDNGRVKDYTLRSSMRALEDVLSRHSLVRCHRSYYVNPAHVDMVRKDENGFALAMLDREGVKSIPVSKRYYENLTAIL